MTDTQDTFVMSTSVSTNDFTCIHFASPVALIQGEMIEVLNRFKLAQKVEMMKVDPLQRQILRIILKYEMQSLLQKLAEIGEESVVVTANVVDGTHSVLASDHGEKFLQNGVVSSFMDHFVHYLSTGETSDPVDISADLSDAYTSVSRQENNISRSSASSSEEPETFMHMKKHQIEHFNRKRDYEDRAIDETVSKLVKNILREGKAKEKKSTSVTDQIFGALKRKSMYSHGYNYQHNSDHNKSSKRKRKHVADYFPTLLPMLKPKSSDYPPNSFLYIPRNENRDSENVDDDVIAVKIEPPDTGEYGGSVSDSDRNDTGQESKLKDKDIDTNNDCSDRGKDSQEVEIMGESSESGKCKDKNVMIQVPNNGESSNSCDKSENSVSSVTLGKADSQMSKNVKIKTEEDIDLPFVEEYYQNRTKCLEDVKLTPEEMTSKANVHVSCYKQSRKKSNTFNLVLNGYLYIKDKQGNTGTIYWKCGRVGCKGRVIQRGQELIISQSHIHAPSYKQEAIDP